MKTFKSLPDLTSLQKEIITGSLLGDGCLNASKDHRNFKFSKGQSKFDKDGVDKKSYMNWHFNSMELWSSNLKEGTITNKFNKKTTLKQKAYYRYMFTTFAHPFITDLAKKWYKNDGNVWLRNKNNKRIKTIPKDLVLTPLVLCIWLMDDGFCYPKNANMILCTHGFAVEEVDFLVTRLKEDLGIKSKRRIEWRGYPIIYIGRESYFDVIEMVKPHVKWDCFKYKLDTATYNKNPKRGETHPLAKLTEERVKYAFKLRSENVSQEDIANELKVSKAHISMILAGKLWSHLGLKMDYRLKPRINEEKKAQAIELRKTGLTYEKIAEILNVSYATVSRAIARSC